METTLNQIKKNDPCEDGWKKLLFYLGKTDADDEPLSIRTILESNGIEHAIWALRAVEGHNREIRLFAADCAESVLHIFNAKYPNDDRPRKAIEAARKCANEEIDEYELCVAKMAAIEAATRAAWEAEWGARRAAMDTEWATMADTRIAAMADAICKTSVAARVAERDKQMKALLKYI